MTQQTRPQTHRKRIGAATGAALVIFLGLIIRHNSAMLPLLIRKFAPDTLWALMIFCLTLGLWPHFTTRANAIIAFGFCVLIETSQLLGMPALMALRATRFGGLVLGHGFLWSDIACYATGIALGIAIICSQRWKKMC